MQYTHNLHAIHINVGRLHANGDIGSHINLHDGISTECVPVWLSTSSSLLNSNAGNRDYQRRHLKELRGIHTLKNTRSSTSLLMFRVSDQQVNVVNFHSSFEPIMLKLQGSTETLNHYRWQAIYASCCLYMHKWSQHLFYILRTCII